jgi:hypothetical protein
VADGEDTPMDFGPPASLHSATSMPRFQPIKTQISLMYLAAYIIIDYAELREYCFWNQNVKFEIA